MTNNKQPSVQYVPKKAIAPAFGYALSNKAVVREDLRPRIKKFVIAHELHHLHDRSEWGGWVGRELRANIAAGIKHPVGLIETILASLTPSRPRFYVGRLHKGE